MKKMMAQLLLITFSLSTFATQPQNEVKNIVKKYDYLLTSHPQAHEADFRAETIESFEDELNTFIDSASDEELKAGFATIINQIPSQEKRASFLKILSNSSDAELAKYLSDPELLSQSIQGEGANFFMGLNTFGSIAVIAIGAFVLYAAINTAS